MKAALLNPKIEVLAFEPIDSLFSLIENTILELNIKNLKVIKCAVSNYSGNMNMFIEKSGDHLETSSLKQPIFSEMINFQFVSKEIKVEPLSSYVDSKSPINFLKCDAQGNDIEVLMGLGSALDRLEMGMIEVAATDQSAMYENESTLLNALMYLRDNNFEPYRINANDIQSMYFNIYFARKDHSWEKAERDLGLDQISIYTQGRYWHVPSPYQIEGWIAWTKEVVRRAIHYKKRRNFF